jgi:hypothetical protein
MSAKIQTATVLTRQRLDAVQEGIEGVGQKLPKASVVGIGDDEVRKGVNDAKGEKGDADQGIADVAVRVSHGHL